MSIAWNTWWLSSGDFWQSRNRRWSGTAKSGLKLDFRD
jgi:hypothetical protein